MIGALDLALRFTGLAEQPELLATMREDFQGEHPSLMLPEVVQAGDAATLRALIEERAAAFSIPNRGAYHQTPVATQAVAALESVVSIAIGRRATLIEVHAQRLAHRDFHLVLDDQLALHRLSLLGEPHLDVVIDVSIEMTGEAEVVYVDPLGEPKIVLPQLPGSVCIVERSPAPSNLGRYYRYVTHRVGERRVHRLLAKLRYATEAK